MPDDVTLIGLDFGTTTSSAVVASARLVQSSVTGRRELGEIDERFRSEMAFTPLDGDDRLDERAMERRLDDWLDAGQVDLKTVFGGGALLTGLTAQKENASALVRMVRRRLGDALIATADDPRLESWLAFMGSCAGLSRSRPGQPVFNLDIGGGTTNLALGVDGQVLRTGCYFVGARHVQVVPGTYRVVKLSRYAQALMRQLEIERRRGDDLSEDDVRRIAGFYVELLEQAAGRTPNRSPGPAEQLHIQVPFRPLSPPGDLPAAAITFSGGVGELIYAHIDGKPWPATTAFGDLGIDLAQRIITSPLFAPHLRNVRPASAGRATVYGLLRHSTEVSGATLFLPRPEVLPLTDVPIFGNLDRHSSDERLRDLIDLVRHSPRGGCLRIVSGAHDAATVRTFGQRMASALRSAAFPPDRPLVVLIPANLGKVLGHYLTEWGALPLNVVIIDEVTVRDAQFVQIGAARGQVVPVSFYGLNEPGERP